MVAFPQVTALAQAETLSRRVAHFFHYPLKADSPLVVKTQHHGQRVLHQRATGRAVKIRLLFFGPGMRGVVGRNDIESIVEQSL